MEKQKLTSYSVNESLQILEKEILEKTGLSRAVLHRKAIDYFYNSEDHHIHPRLLITKKTDPLYVRRSRKEPVYVTEDMRRKMREIGSLPYNNCTDGVVFFHALMTYCGLHKGFI